MTRTIWTPEREEEIRSLWFSGHTVSEIAKKQNTTRSTIAGKLCRMGHLGVCNDKFRFRQSSIKIDPDKVCTGSWDAKVFEPYALFKIRKQRERANVRV